MKALKILIAFLFFSCIVAETANAQAVVIKDHTWHWLGYESTDAHQVVAPDGTINLLVTFMLPLDNPYVPTKEVGTIVYVVYAEFKMNDIEYLIRGTMTVNPNGRAKGNFHWEPTILNQLLILIGLK